MGITVTTLVENTVPQGAKGLLGEHGLSFWVESQDRIVLFDTGQGLALENNAGVLGKALEDVEVVVLSHGHHDHSGGLPKLIEANRNFTLIAHPEAFGEKVSQVQGKFMYRGIPVTQSFLRDKGITVQLSRESVEIAPGVRTTGEIPLKTEFEAVESVFFTRKEGAEVPDPLMDDQALLLETPEGLAVLLGCSHRGPINTLAHISQLSGGRKIHTIMGGLHLGKASDGTIDRIVRALQGMELQKIVVGHCTGFRAIMALAQVFGEKFHLNSVGEVLRLESLPAGPG